MSITFITGNQSKADYLAKYLGFEVEHHKLDLDELQSLDLKQIVEHKVRQAYEKLHAPVIVEDVSLEFTAFGRLPGPFIKFFLWEMSSQQICSLLDDKRREAVGRCMFGYFDGAVLKLLEGELHGKIANQPAGNNGFGWDDIFIPDGYDVTRAQLDEEDYRKVYLQIRPLTALKTFLQTTLPKS
ncbi:MAG TPA: non-canonical purine NTP pyrophosphatase [Candidatus Acidoferrum sp.]|nr:non-canonical purine NTP pyrophosphatase [Candidatus Acidoferrum sp.]